MMTLRSRLILWHSSVFAVGLLGFALVIWFGSRQILNTEIERWLSTQAEGVDRFVHVERKGTDEAAIIEEAREFSTGLPQGSGVQLFRGDGQLLLSRPEIPFVAHATGQSGSAVVDGERTRFISRTVSIEGERYRFVLWRSYEDADATLGKLAQLLASLAPVFLLLSVAGGWWLSRRSLQPVDDLTSAARSMSLSKLSSRLPLPAAHDELYRLCQAWNEMLARLEESALRLNQFTADASHELRTPLAVIRATSELALRQQRGPEAYRDALQSVKEQSVEMSNLVEDLLTLARSESAQIRSSFAVVDLAALIEELQSATQSRATACGHVLLVSVPGRPAYVTGDQASLRRLLTILIDNALKFTPPPGRIELRVEQDATGSVTFSVTDTGVGISPEAIPRIYDRFYQSDPSRAVPGTGLGLSLARWIVASHDADIDVESTVGQGSTFRISFPAQHDPAGSFVHGKPQ